MQGSFAPQALYGMNSPTNEKKESSYGRLALRYFVLTVGFFALYVVGYNLYGFVEQKIAQRGVAQFAGNLKAAQEQEDARRRQDTYGGKTPQETLRLYIEAVEKRDFDLASKYFVWSEQKKERDSLGRNEEKILNSYVAQLRESFAQGGEMSYDGSSYVYRRPLYVNLVKYEQNGVWKIASI